MTSVGVSDDKEPAMKAQDSAVTALQGVELFHGLDAKTLGRIAQQTKSYHFREGESVIDADASGRFGRLYTIISGTAVARIGDEEVATYGPGDHFGEMSVLDGSPRSAAIVATSDLETLGLSAWNMRTILREEPDVAMHVIEALVGRLRKQNAALYD
jgi:CRP/FNR family transcriptional regulator, cyclic AMP receptor protein